jgi:hypothetical protein
MKLFKKTKAYFSFVLLTSLFIQPLFLPVQLLASQKHCNQQTSQEEYFKGLQQPTDDSECRNDLTYYIDITPEALNGLNLKELFRLVIEHSYTTNTLLELPQELMNCCKALENDATSLFMPDLVKALPIVVEKMMDPIMQEIMLRAPRIDTPGTNGAIVGPLIDCNFDEVLRLLNKLINLVKACCDNIQIDFNGVFTALADLEVTVTVDFSGTFSVLDDIKNTLTICCENIENNFEGTFTVLNDINNTLTTCCAALQADFNGVFTVLEDLEVTVTVDFSGTFSVLDDIKNTLTACCGNFQNTFTVLNDINNTLTIDFAGTFSVLNDISNTLTTCCSTLQFDFNGAFTAIAAITTPTITMVCDFSSIFTVLNTEFNATFTALDDIKNTITACCANITNEFNGTFTAIDAINTEANATFTVLDDIKNTITACCANITNEFNGTFTAIDAINTEANATFTALADIKNTITACCANITNEFNGTFSSLNDIKNTVTIDFAGTFSVLNQILANETSGTFSALNAGFNGTFTALNDIKNTLTACCANITNEFNGTFSVLANLSSICSSSSIAQGFISIFGDAIVEGRLDQVSNLFEYGVTSYDITTSTFSSGLIQSFTSMAIITSGTGATAFAQIQSKKYLKYMAGHDGYAFFSALWPNNSAGSTQWIGTFDANDGVAVGFNGTTFSILFRQNAVDTTIPQSSFNLDKLDGTGSSGFVLTTTDLNVFRIDYGWTGGTQINFQILGTTGKWISFHQINNTNVMSNPSFGNPILPLTAQVTKTSGATNVTIATAGWNAGIIAEPSVAQSRFFTAGQLTKTAISSVAETFIVAFQNKSTYQAKPNKVIVRISFASVGMGVTGATVTVFRLVRNATITGTAFSDVDTANSVMQISTAGAYTAGTGSSAFMFMNTNAVPSSTFIPEKDLTVYLYPGETLTITGLNIAGAGQTAVAMLAWEERF